MKKSPFLSSVALLFWLTGPLEGAGTGWTTDGTRILAPDGTEFNVTGINWFGFETRDAVAHGLWAVDYTTVVDQVRQYGYNTIRIPFSNEMWETNPSPRRNSISACPDCSGKTSRDIMALIVNYAGSVGLHVILDNHRSDKGNSAQQNGLWYTSSFPEQNWIADWVAIQEWIHGIAQPADTVAVNYLAADGYPVVLGFDLRNEPHTPANTAYVDGATWGTGDGIDPFENPNPNPFAPLCAADSTCHDWRLAAERAGTTILGEADAQGWDYPLIFVEGISTYPVDGGTAADGPYDWTWWGGNLLGVNGNSTNPGAPVLLNAGGDASGLGPAVETQVVYSAHDYGPELFQQPWFNSQTSYSSGCTSSSLADVWHFFWAYVNSGGVNPTWPGHASYPWGNTGHAAYTEAPMWLGEFGTGNNNDDLHSTGAGSQGQWFTNVVNFVQSSFNLTSTNDSGIPVKNLHWTYWSVNGNDSAHGLLDSSWTALANPDKNFSFLCFIQWGPLASPDCGSTGPLPPPDEGPGCDGGTCDPAAAHVDSIVVTTVNISGGQKAGRAEVVIVDDCGNPVSGATVTGTFSGSISETVSASTDSNGLAVLQTTGTASGRVQLTFCVDDVTHSSLVYDPNANVETCDSN